MPTCNRCAKPFDGAGETCGPCQDYTDRREAKADRYRGFSENAGRRSVQAFGAVDRLASMIPLGQPILVGHHSEGRARADRRRIDNGMRRGIDEGKRADHWERRADAVEDDKSIRSDDPAAVVKLRDKIAELEAKRDKMKRINSLYRKGDVEALAALDLDYEVLKVKVDAAYSWEKAPFPGYAMTNLGGNIRRYKGRLKEAEAQAVARA